MQRTEDGGVVISCDFCATDWDEVKPMIEGHQGSVICLECTKLAFEQMAVDQCEFSCTLCLREGLPTSLARWTHPRRPQALICGDCLEQATGAFDKDPNVPWDSPPVGGAESVA